MEDRLQRISSPDADEHLGEFLKVGDHGFVRLVDYLGSDESIVNAARISYGKGTRTKRDNEGLIRYLLRKRHTSPSEMIELVLHMRLPIFVGRQLVRHRTFNLNEVSARYSELPDEYWAFQLEISNDDTHNPKVLVRGQGVKNRQGSEGLIEVPYDLLEKANRCAWTSHSVYHDLLEAGVTRELARVHLPLSTMTEWIWKCDLHNIRHMLELRLDSHAQEETREYAAAVLQCARWVAPTFIRIWEELETDKAKGLEVIKAARVFLDSLNNNERYMVEAGHPISHTKELASLFTAIAQLDSDFKGYGE